MVKEGEGEARALEVNRDAIPGWRAEAALTLAPHAGCPRGDPALATMFDPLRGQRNPTGAVS